MEGRLKDGNTVILRWQVSYFGFLTAKAVPKGGKGEREKGEGRRKR